MHWLWLDECELCLLDQCFDGRSQSHLMVKRIGDRIEAGELKRTEKAAREQNGQHQQMRGRRAEQGNAAEEKAA